MKNESEASEEEDELNARGHHLADDKREEDHFLETSRLADPVLHKGRGHQDDNRDRLEKVQIEGEGGPLLEGGNLMEKVALKNGGHQKNGVHQEVHFGQLQQEVGLNEDEGEAGGGDLDEDEVEAGGHLDVDEVEAGGPMDEVEAGGHLNEDEMEAGGHLDEVEAGGHLPEDEQEDVTSQAVFLTSHLDLQMEIGEVRKANFFYLIPLILWYR